MGSRRVGDRRRVVVSLVVGVLAPFVDVAVHVADAEGVAASPADRLRLAADAASEHGLLGADDGPEARGRRRPGAAGVLPLRFGRQAILPPLLAAEPFTEG